MTWSKTAAFAVRSLIVLWVVVAGCLRVDAQFAAYGTWNVSASTSHPFTLRGAPGMPDEIAYFDNSTVPPTLVTLSATSGTIVQTSSSPAVGPVVAMASGDVDADGMIDIVVATTNYFSVYRRTATGFVPLFGPVYDSGPYMNLHLADRDNDGDLDIFIRHLFYVNDGAGTFTYQWFSTIGGAWIRDFHVADVDSDGYQDILYASSDDVNLLGTIPDGGTVGTEQIWDTSTTSRIFWRVLDVDADGIKDIWWIDRSSTPTNSVFVRGIGGGAFAAAVMHPVPAALTAAGIQEFVGADIDGDGRDEIAATVVQPPAPVGLTSLYAIDATGALVLIPSTGAVLSGLGGLASGDIDGDGRDDLFGIVAGTTPTLSVFRSTAAPRPMSIKIVAGAGQTITALDSTTVPVIVEVIDNTTGSPAPGVPVTVSPDAGITVTTIAGTTTASDGRIQFHAIGDFVTGQKSVRLTLADGTTTEVPLIVVPPATLSIVSGNGQYAYTDSTTYSPVVFGATRPNGTPWVGGAVTLSTTPTQIMPPGSSPAVTDLLGRVSVTPYNTALGTPTVTARIGIGGRAPRTTATLAMRRLLIYLLPGANHPIILFYNHEDGPTPLIIAADFPRTPIPTPSGIIETSILSPQPGFIFLDGVGLFGTADPFVIADPDYIHVSAVPPALFGLSVVFQVYGIDPDYPFPQSIIISPAVTVTF